MDYNYIKPFIDSTVEIIKEVANTEARKMSTYMIKGKQKKLTNGLYIDITGDVFGRIIFDIPFKMGIEIAERMIGNSIGVDQKENLINNAEFIELTIGELGNLVSGRAITVLEASQYNCFVYPPITFTENDTGGIIDEESTSAAIEFETDMGNFDVYISNRDEAYTRNISIMLFNITNNLLHKAIYSFIPRGFYIYAASTEEQAKQLLEKASIDFIIGDFDNINDGKKNFLSYIRDNELTKDIKIASYTGQKEDEKFKQIMQNFDIYFLIPKVSTKLDFMQGVSNFLYENCIKEGERRKHIRLNIEPNEKFIINCIIDNISVTGIIIDLSIGTIFFKVSVKQKDLFDLKQKIQNIVIMKDNVKLVVNGLVFFKKSNLIGIKLMNIHDYALRVFCDIIFEKSNNNYMPFRV